VSFPYQSVGRASRPVRQLGSELGNLDGNRFDGSGQDGSMKPFNSWPVHEALFQKDTMIFCAT
jgi:hypothetical protein